MLRLKIKQNEEDHLLCLLFPLLLFHLFVIGWETGRLLELQCFPILILFLDFFTHLLMSRR